MSANNNPNDPSNEGGLSVQPLTYVIIPLVAIGVLGVLAIVWYRRRQRRLHPERYQAWDRDGVLPPGGHPMHSRRNRWAPWAGSRSAEGLNELGEAPPPYQKDGEQDIELGTRPPGYNLPTEPEPVMLRDATNSGTQPLARSTVPAEETEEGSNRRLSQAGSSRGPDEGHSVTALSEVPGEAAEQSQQSMSPRRLSAAAAETDTAAPNTSADEEHAHDSRGIDSPRET